MQAEGHSSFPNIADSVIVPVATQFAGAQDFTIRGNPILTNIGVNTGLNNYGRTQGLKKLENFVSFAAVHNSAEQDPDRRCHPETRENGLSRLRHYPNPTKRIFWLRCRKVGNSTDPRRNDGNRLSATIAWQLAFSIPVINTMSANKTDKSDT